MLRRICVLCLELLAALAIPVIDADALTPPKCIDAVRKLDNDIRLRIQGGARDQVIERANAKEHISIAGRAAGVGNQKECWRQYHWALSAIR